MNNWSVIEWSGCYPSNWKGVVVTEAMAHPAKFSSRLIRRIYDHMLEEGWVRAGDAVVDPFGGVALGALEAMRHGLHWTGVELEERFHKIGNANIEKWTREYGTMLKGSARLLHGDSRFMLKLMAGASADGGPLTVDGVVGSPPYAETELSYKKNGLHVDGKEKYERPYMQGQEDDYGVTPGQLGAMKANETSYQLSVSSPPYSTMQVEKNTKSIDRTKQYEAYKKSGGGQTFEQFCHTQDFHSQGYGDTDGQLANMPIGNFEVSISSPPFLQSEGGTPEPKPGGVIDAAMYERHAAGNKKANGYGHTEGQLHHMRDGGFELSVSSQPYENTNVGNGDGEKELQRLQAKAQAGLLQGEHLRLAKQGRLSPNENAALEGYGADDFWLSARAIVEQVYESLAPGGHACWVVKDYVKAKQIVPFADQWRQLCEAVGFETLHEHRAMLVHHKGRQGLLEGGVKDIKTESKSFFRRLAEKKGSPRIDWEVVWCMQKP